LRTVASDLVSDMAISRSEASKRSQRVVMCRSNDQNTCSGSAWTDGWISFVDTNSNGAHDSGESLIRVKQATPTSVSIVESSSATSIAFRAIGIVDATKTFTICPATNPTGFVGRRITMTSFGKVQSSNFTC